MNLIMRARLASSLERSPTDSRPLRARPDQQGQMGEIVRPRSLSPSHTRLSACHLPTARSHTQSAFPLAGVARDGLFQALYLLSFSLAARVPDSPPAAAKAASRSQRPGPSLLRMYQPWGPWLVLQVRYVYENEKKWDPDAGCNARSGPAPSEARRFSGRGNKGRARPGDLRGEQKASEGSLAQWAPLPDR